MHIEFIVDILSNIFPVLVQWFAKKKEERPTVSIIKRRYEILSILSITPLISGFGNMIVIR